MKGNILRWALPSIFQFLLPAVSRLQSRRGKPNRACWSPWVKKTSCAFRERGQSREFTGQKMRRESHIAKHSRDKQRVPLSVQLSTGQTDMWRITQCWGKSYYKGVVEQFLIFTEPGVLHIHNQGEKAY